MDFVLNLPLGDGIGHEPYLRYSVDEGSRWWVPCQELESYDLGRVCPCTAHFSDFPQGEGQRSNCDGIDWRRVGGEFFSSRLFLQDGRDV